MKRLLYYFEIWKHWGFDALQEAFVNRGSNALFLLGKTMRLAMTLGLLLLIKRNIKTFAGYTGDEMVVFFLVYQFIDNVAQSLYRGVYTFGRKVREGEFDFDLMKPISPLFRALMGEPDINDVIFLIPSTAISIYILTTLNLNITIASTIGFVLLLFVSIAIATAFHIIVLSVAIFTTDIDGMVWMYRDLTRLGQFPVSAYLELMRFALFFIVPIGMMITIPAQYLINVDLSYNLLIDIAVGAVFFGFSLWLWNKSLRSYTSASS